MAAVLSLFFIKTKSAYQNQQQEKSGLVYNSNETVKDLVNQDTDGDGIPDWEESLYGTDPTKVDTIPGTPDSVTIAERQGTADSNGTPASTGDNENLTETDKFSRSLVSTVAALNQTGGLDQTTIDNLSSSLEAELDNPVPQKIFTSSDVKTTPNSAQSVLKYHDDMNNLFNKYPDIYNKSGVITSIANLFAGALQNYLNNPEDPNSLANLDTLTKGISGMISGMSKIVVPQEFLSIHLGLMNGFERVLENVSGIKQVDSDPVLAIGGANKFMDNLQTLQEALSALINGLKNIKQ